MYATTSELVSASSLSLSPAVNGTTDAGINDDPTGGRQSSFGLSAIKLEDSASAVRLAPPKTRSRPRETIDLVSDDDECDGDADQAAAMEEEEEESLND